MKKNKNAFTLIELLIVIAFVAILIAIAIPSYIAHIEKTKATTDNYTLRGLNGATQVYYFMQPSPNPFEVSGTADAVLLQTLVSERFYTEAPVPKQKDASFTWDYGSKIWLLSGINGQLTHVLLRSEVTLGTGGHSSYIYTYTGTETDISIPQTLDGTTITNIYQDVFANKGLTSVTFSADSGITQIHARAFKNNNITEIILPNSLRKLDYGAFLDNNNITTVTIGSNVILESKVFRNNELFKVAYTENGAGTYVYISGAWVKQ